jgi:hypothetical protein
LTERTEAAGIEALALSPRMGDFNEDLRAFGLGRFGWHWASHLRRRMSFCRSLHAQGNGQDEGRMAEAARNLRPSPSAV